MSWLVSHQPVVSQIVRESVNYFSDHLGNWPVNKLIISQLFRKSVIKLVSQSVIKLVSQSVVSCRSDNLSWSLIQEVNQEVIGQLVSQ